MALTRVQVQTILLQRTGKLLTAAGLDGTTVEIPNSDLNDPIAYALYQLGEAVADPTDVADVDLASVSSTAFQQLFDLAELRTLMNVQNQLTLVDEAAGNYKESLGQIGTRLEKRIAALEAALNSKYGLVKRQASFKVY